MRTKRLKAARVLELLSLDDGPQDQIHQPICATWASWSVLCSKLDNLLLHASNLLAILQHSCALLAHLTEQVKAVLRRLGPRGLCRLH